MIIVTVEGKPARRYAVVPEDEHMFAEVPNGKVPAPETGTVYEIRTAREDHLGAFYFGCQRVRKSGIDEMYRTLGTWEIVRVTRK